MYIKQFKYKQDNILNKATKIISREVVPHFFILTSRRSSLARYSLEMALICSSADWSLSTRSSLMRLRRSTYKCNKKYRNYLIIHQTKTIVDVDPETEHFYHDHLPFSGRFHTKLGAKQNKIY